MKCHEYESARLKLAGQLIAATADAYRNRKHSLSAIEKFNYEWALKVSARALAPAKFRREAIAQFEQELTERRARAEAARASRVRGGGAAAQTGSGDRNEEPAQSVLA